MSLFEHFVTISSLLYLLFINIVASIPYTGCKFNITDTRNITSEYDLSAFWFAAEIHEVDDSTLDMNGNTEFEYKFNICGKISPEIFTQNTTIPSYCIGDNHGPCLNFQDVNGTTTCSERVQTTTKDVASAVQIDSDINTCYWLGMEVSNVHHLPDYTIELLDADDSGAGVKYTIKNGEFCEGGINRNRELQIDLRCPDETHSAWDPSIQPKITEPVVEGPACVYTISFEHPFACPSGCYTVDTMDPDSYSVCSLHGICAADPNTGTSHCLCDEGYIGTYCQTEHPDITVVDVDNDNLITAIVIFVVALVICFGIAVYLCYVWRKTDESIKKGNLGGGINATNIDFEPMIDEHSDDDDDDGDVDNDVVHGSGVRKTKDTFHPNIGVDDKTHREMAQAIKKEIELQDDTKDNVTDNKTTDNDQNIDVVVDDADGDADNPPAKKNTVVIDDPHDPNEIVPGDDEIDYVE